MNKQTNKVVQVQLVVKTNLKSGANTKRGKTR